MSDTYNLYNLEAPFKEYLLAGNQKPVSVKNYLSDIRHFFGWLVNSDLHRLKIVSNQLETLLTPTVVNDYKNYFITNNLPHKTINRRLSTVRKFCSFCISQGWLKENPAKKVLNIGGVKEVRINDNNKALESPKLRKDLHGLKADYRRLASIKSRFINFFKRTPRKSVSGSAEISPSENPLPISGNLSLQHYIGLIIILIFVSVMGAGIYNQFFVKNRQSLAYPTALTRAGRILSFQGRLTDTLSNPITTATNVQFKLYSVSTGGTALYATGTCSTTPDGDGIFNSLIGSDCGAEIASSVFSENTNVYLGVTVGADAEMTPRQQIANVGYAINAETLQGLPPGANTSNIPYINSDGSLLIAAASPGIRSTYTSTDFTLSSAKAAVIQAAGAGDIILQATESGTLKFRTGGATDAYTRITVDNAGLVGIGTTGPTQKLDITGNLQFSGALMPNSAAGTSGQFLISGGAGNPPTWTSTVAATSVPWSLITNPAADLSLSMETYKSTFTYNAATSTNNLFNLTDTLNNTGTGYLLNLTTASGSTLKPLHISSAGTEAVYVDATGNVGIGTTAPTVGFKVDVTGAERVSNGLTVAASGITVTGSSTITGTLGSLTGLSSSGTIAFSGLSTNGPVYTSGGTGTLNSEQYLDMTRGGTDADLSGVATGGVIYKGASALAGSGALTGMLKGNTASAPSAVTSTAAYVTYWSDANTIAGEQYLATSRGGLGASVTAAGAGELLYSSATTTYGHLAAGSSGQIIKSGGAGAPTWNTAAALTKSDDTNVTLALGGSPTTALVNAASITVGWTGQLAIARGGTNSTATPTAGGVAYGTGTAYAFNSAGTSGQFLISGGAGAPTWTSTVPATSLAWSNLTNPTANLALSMAAYTTAFTWNAATGANNLFTFADTTSNTGTGYLINIATATGSGVDPFHVSARGTEALMVNEVGNVGIGTVTPGSKLQVNGNAVIGYSASTAGPANGLAISGNVGIGTTEPGEKLNVNGFVKSKNYQVSEQGLVLGMNFNSVTISGTAGSEKIRDSSGYNNHGTNYGATHNATGGFNGGGALSFDGVDDYVKVPDDPSLDITDEITIEMWINPKKILDDTQSMFNRSGVYGGPFLFDLSRGKLRFVINQNWNTNDDVTGNKTLTQDVFQHVAVTWRGDTRVANIFLNGSLEKTQTTDSSVLPTTVNNATIGCRSSKYFNGLIDEVRIYNRALSAQEIFQLYLTPYAGLSDASLVYNKIEQTTTSFIQQIMQHKFIPPFLGVL